jgi:lysophospholipase L1-like esterase
MYQPKFNTIVAILACHVLAFPVCARESATITQSSTPESRMEQGAWKSRWDAQLQAIGNGGDCRLIFMGDSITQGWGGPGKAVWEREFAAYKPINFGIGGDRTEHLLWRIRNAPGLAKIKPQAVALMIGTNNTGHNLRAPEDTADGIRTIIGDLRKLWPDSRIILFAIFPRGENPADPRRKNNDAINKIIATFDDGKHVHYLDISSDFLDADGSLPKEIMPDLLHLSPKGYEIWGKALAAKLKDLGL